MRDIRSGQILGKVPAFLWVIEFQKRGLPHAHLLVILSNDDRVSCSIDVDNIISAELPPNPTLFPDGSKQRAQAERLESIVMQNMVHGPCGRWSYCRPVRCRNAWPGAFLQEPPPEILSRGRRALSCRADVLLSRNWNPPRKPDGRNNGARPMRGEAGGPRAL